MSNLPAGWEKHVSKSTGFFEKSYSLRYKYFNFFLFI